MLTDRDRQRGGVTRTGGLGGKYRLVSAAHSCWLPMSDKGASDQHLGKQHSEPFSLKQRRFFSPLHASRLFVGSHPTFSALFVLLWVSLGGLFASSHLLPHKIPVTHDWPLCWGCRWPFGLCFPNIPSGHKFVLKTLL